MCCSDLVLEGLVWEVGAGKEVPRVLLNISPQFKKKDLSPIDVSRKAKQDSRFFSLIGLVVDDCHLSLQLAKHQ